MAKPKAILGAQSNLVYDGHSAMSGQGGGGQSISTFIAQKPTTAGGTWTNVAIPGQGWKDMIDNPTDVDAAWQAGKTNVLILWEHVNTLYFNGYTVAQTLAAVKQYIAARRALNPWLVVLIDSYPQQGASGTYYTLAGIRVALAEIDAAIGANPAFYGIDAMVHIRQKGSFCDLPDFSDASFLAMGDVWVEQLGNFLHFNANGYSKTADMLEDTLRNLRGVPHQ
jgi:lysophospholipase L1-like esterase